MESHVIGFNIYKWIST